MKKNKKRKNDLENRDPQNEKGKKALGVILLLFVNFALFYALFRLIIALAEKTGVYAIYYAGTSVYVAALCGLFIAFFCLNGFTFDKKPREIEELPESWSYEKKCDFMKKQPARRAKARKLIFFLLPLVAVLFISYIELFLIK